MSNADAHSSRTTCTSRASTALVVIKDIPQSYDSREGGVSSISFGPRVEPDTSPQHPGVGHPPTQCVYRLFEEPPATVLALTTEGYRLALNNRLAYDKLLPHSMLDVQRWPPIFVYDILMLPGTLAQHLGKESETDVIDRITPAKLQGYRALIRTGSGDPCLVVSQNPADVVHGLMIFGQGKESRSHIRRHYRRHSARRVRVEAMVETMVPMLRTACEPHWTRQATTIMTDVFIRQSHSTQESSTSLLTPWTFEDFLSGAYS